MRVPLKFKGLIFDHDGTLVDSLSVVVAATNTVLRTRGFSERPAAEVVAGMVLPTAPRMVAIAGTADAALGEAMAVEFYREANRLPHLAFAYEGVVGTLQGLVDRGQRLAMVSNNQGRFIRIVGSRLGLLEFFPVVIGEEDMPAPKPDPRGLIQAAAGLALTATECAYVGDSPGDALAARAAGMAAIGCTWGIHHRSEMDAMGFDVLIDHPQELLALG